MLAKKQRLSGQIDHSFFQQAQKKPTELGLLYYQENDQMEHAQFAFIAPKKTFPRSVQRHQAKRLAATIIQKEYKQFLPGKYVFLLKK
jgi:ribonuclease P protein component